jgi:hypothetical protein
MSYHAAYPTHAGLVAVPYGMVGAPNDYAGLCAMIANQGEQDGRLKRDPVDGFDAMEERMRAEGVITTMPLEDARTCYMQGYERGWITPAQAATGGLVLGGIGGVVVGILGTRAVQRWL